MFKLQVLFGNKDIGDTYSKNFIRITQLRLLFYDNTKDIEYLFKLY